jgi:hypothetical protein
MLADDPEDADDDLNNQLLPGAAAITEAERRISDAAADPGAGKQPTHRTANGFRARLPAASSNPAPAPFFALRHDALPAADADIRPKDGDV